MTLFDAGVVGTVLLLGLICFALGFVRVVLGIAGWVGAALVTLYGFSFVQPIARAHIGISMLADVVAGFALFVISLIVINLFTHAIARAVRGSSLRALDKTLGLVLGLAMGAVGVCIAYILLAPIARADNGAPPVWMQRSRTLPLIEWGAGVLRGVAPEELRSKVPAMPREETDPREMERRLLSPGATPPPPAGRSGYTDDQRRELDRLIGGQQ